MSKGTAIWLILLTLWLGYKDFASFMNYEIRERNKEIRKQNIEALQEFINGPLNKRISNIEKFIDESIQPYLHEHPE